jgi:hypothetical protein
MTYDWLAAVSSAKIVIAFLFFFVYLPAKLFPQRRGAPLIERLLENLVLMASSSIILVHVLSLARIYSVFTLLACYVLLHAAWVWYREGVSPIKRLKRFAVEKTILALDVLDGVVDLRALGRARLATAWEPWKAYDRHDVVHGILFGAVLLLSAALRYTDVFQSSAFGFSDPYTHLLWTKNLEAGVPYPSGIRDQFYPKGFHAFLAILHGLSGLDGSLALRATGPLVGTLLVVAVYYTGRSLTRNRDAALIGMGLFGFAVEVIHLLGIHFNDAGVLTLPQDIVGGWFIRQSTPLPEEFGLVFLMPALLTAFSYLTGDGRKRPYILFWLASLTIFTVHSLIGMTLGLGMAALVGLAVLLRASSWRAVFTLGGGFGAAGFLGSLSILYGQLFAKVEQGSQEAYYAEWLRLYGKLPYDVETVAGGALGLLFLIGGVIAARTRPQRLLWSFFGLYLLILVFFSRSLNVGIMYVIPPDRVGRYMLIVLCAVAAGLYSLVTLFPFFAGWYRKRSWIYQAATVLTLAALGIGGFPTHLPEPPRYEYDSFAKTSYAIKRDFPPLEWTIVSTVEDYSKVFRDKGWHLNASEFLQRFSPYDRTLELPPPYVFLFVEKKPFHDSSDGGIKDPALRLDLQRRMLEWGNIYSVLHSDISIYYEDWDVVVYLIDRSQPSTSNVAHGPQMEPQPTRLSARLFPPGRQAPSNR